MSSSPLLPDAIQMEGLARRYPDVLGRRPVVSLRQALFSGVAIVALLYALSYLDVNVARVWQGLDRMWLIVAGMLRPSAGGAFPELFRALLESLGMAFLGTLIASVVALFIGFMGARNVVPSRWLRFSFRRGFDFLRGIDALVWALIYVRAVGLGPLAGVLAIASSDIGTLSKLYAEAIESADRKPAEGIRSAGGNRLQILRFGILPQVLPIMLSNALYMFESNTRSATILGIVGAGGIGFQLSDRIRAHRWDEVSFIILMIIAAVFLIDLISRYVRVRLIQGKTGANTIVGRQLET